MIATGGCHCGAVRFQVEAELPWELERCNCSVCSKSGYLHLIVPHQQFSLLQGEENLTTYIFNSGVAKHFFCKTCGIKPFYVPRSNPDGMDVNVNCLDEVPTQVEFVEFDGRNWEKNAHKLAHKTQS
ncbi:MAG TPA: aldehyde-activating protein [Gammaproteobacteria bacterium]|uniref:GFA family protein n=1 Tax=OM182 bacterium TaxID=2510334 RepID=A0A520S081_9GAMM|nr:MAG: GFA family protein [Gammaproteobacteria bacterium TMED163]RZO75882.1 MAG: GFA family protein [OM182 bacterium]HAO89479.1 aldehyde-activating protein [Gammaproteobacteria bacterium]HAR90855.1 aldehyde-activating protein [Gammaproteobacteria bacterium]HAU23945.1 aldehyde-activating protein [Gammaproteobacteria bacterium]